MITLPVVLIAVAVLLLLALLLGLFLQRRRAARATPPGPRTVADLVQQRADREPVPAAGPGPEMPSTVDESAPGAEVEPGPVAASGPVTDGAPADGSAAADPAAAEPAADTPAADESTAPEPGPAPVVAARAIAPLGDDVPWRRAAQMSGADDAEPASGPEPVEAGRVPALALLRRPPRRPLPADARHPFLPSRSRPTTVPVEGGDDDPAHAAAEPVAARPLAVRPAEPGPVEDVEAAGEPAGAGVAPTAGSGEAAPAVAGSTDPGATGAEPTRAEPTGGAAADAGPAENGPDGAEVAGPAPVVGAGSTGVDVVTTEPAPGGRAVEDPAAAPLDAAPDAEQADHTRSRFPVAVAGLVAGGIVAVGARGAGGTDGPDPDASVEPPAPGPGPESTERSAGQDPDVGRSAEMRGEGVEGAPDDSPVRPGPEGGGSSTDGSAAARSVALVDSAPGTDVTASDDFPSTDPDVLFDSPPAEPPARAADPVAGAPTCIDAVEAPAADAVPADAVPADAVPADGPVADGPAADAVPADAPVEEAAAADPSPADALAADPLAADPLAADAAPEETPAEEGPALHPSAGTPVPAGGGTETPEGVAAPVVTAPAGGTPDTDDSAAIPVAASVEALRRVPRDPDHVAAEQAAADLALLRTFGDPSARPERAPIVALEGTARPESPPQVGAAQPVRYRAVHRDGTEVSGAAVALLDDRGREVGAGRSAGGGLTAPHPGAYVLVATAPDHQPGAVALTVGDAPVDVEVLLVRSAALVGVVTGEDGPLAGARVTLVQDGEVVEVAETDADGAYLVADLASGEYAVSVAAAGCEADVVLVVVPDETECVHDVELEPAGVPAG